MKIELKRSSEFEAIKLKTPIKIDNVNGSKSYSILTDFHSVLTGVEPDNINLDSLVTGYRNYINLNGTPVSMDYRISTKAGRLLDWYGNFIIFKGGFDDLDDAIPVAKGKGDKITHVYVELAQIPEEYTIGIYDYVFEVALAIFCILLFFTGLAAMIFTNSYSMWNWFIISISLIVGVNSWSKIHEILHIIK